ncbi:hypothetical protein, partial [Corynebacterium sp. KPL2680]|uniref:hypothetical protein n=1 Tax=Corynebacterium sp. KPL2680 TaxID=3158310 RepID=UPI0032EF7C39
MRWAKQAMPIPKESIAKAGNAKNAALKGPIHAMIFASWGCPQIVDTLLSCLGVKQRLSYYHF